METNYSFEENKYIYLGSLILMTWPLAFLGKNTQYILNSAKNNLLELNSKVYVIIAITISTTFITVPLGLVVYVLCRLFRKLLGIVLKLKHGDKFGGFLENMDAMLITEPISKAVIPLCIHANFEGEFDEFCEKVKNRLDERCFSGKYPKMTSTRHKCMGYTYLLRNELHLEECISHYQCTEEVITRETYQRILSNVANEPLPKNHCAFWDVILVDKPIISQMKEKQYFVILRVHHGLCDGIGTHKIFIGCLADALQDDLVVVDSKKITKPLQIYPMTKHALEKIKAIYECITMLVLLPTIFVLMISRKNDIFKNTTFTGKKICVWSCEDEPKYIRVVKEIKNLIPNITFTDVIFSAVSSSIMENIFKNANEHLHYIALGLTAIPYLTEFPEHGKMDLYDLNNDSTSACTCQVPGYMNKTRSCVDRLREVADRRTILNKSFDAKAFYWVLRFAGAIFPNFTTKLLANSVPGAVITNVPGYPNLKLFGGCQVNEVVGFVPNYLTTGFSVASFTYKNRFQFTLLVDKGVVPDEEDARNFTDGIFKHFDRLYEELKKTK